MNNNNDQYIALFNEDSGFNVDNISIKLNNDNNISVDQVDYNLIKSDLPYIILATDISNNTIETKLTNNYIVDDTINQSKIVNLVSDLLAINNKFLDYYLKTDTYTQNEINTLFYNKTSIITGSGGQRLKISRKKFFLDLNLFYYIINVPSVFIVKWVDILFSNVPQ